MSSTQAPGLSYLDTHFDAVSFYYKEDAPLFVDLTLHIEAGTRVAVVGETGSGKDVIAPCSRPAQQVPRPIDSARSSILRIARAALVFASRATRISSFRTISWAPSLPSIVLAVFPVAGSRMEIPA